MGCIDSQPEPIPVPTRRQQKKTQKIRKSRLVTKFSMDEIKQITDEQRNAGYKPVYSCPICFLRFNKILACDECNNCICHKCFIAYQKKGKYGVKCSFCQSSKSMFRDYEGEAHSYFDATGKNGFLPPEERKKLDEQQQLKNGKAQNSKLDPIQEIQAN